jgi:preprotein translocase subunit SecE
VSRNRKRAKERRARRPVARTRAEPETANPLAHSAPDVELAEAQLAVGRPELGGEDEADASAALAAEAEREELEEEREEGDGLVLEEDGELAEDSEDGQYHGGAVARAHSAAAETHVSTFGRLIGFLQGSWRELQRVQWPDRRQVVQATGVVIGFVIVAGVWLGVADTLASKLIDYIIK